MIDGWSKDDEALAFEMIAGQYFNKNFGRTVFNEEVRRKNEE